MSAAYYFSIQFSAKEKLLGKANSWDYQFSNPKEYASKQNSNHAYTPGYKIKLRQGQLLVKQTNKPKEFHLLSNRNEQFLTEWLQYSPARLVRIDAAFGELKLKRWANLCKQFGKEIYLRIPRHQQLPEYHSPIRWHFKRSLDWIIAAGLLIIFSPILLTLVLGLAINSSEPVFVKQWCVGKRGKLFCVYNFRRIVSDTQNQPKQMQLGDLIWKYGLDKLPQLFNILKGEMSLVGRRPCQLCEVIQISPEKQNWLNILPGITGAWQLKDKSRVPILSKIDDNELQDLQYWSFWQDLKILLLTIPKLISGEGFL